MLPCVVVALSPFPSPPSISSKQVRFSSSYKSTIGDLKVVLNFVLGGEVTCSWLNMSFGVGNFVHGFS
jgi:hypothetical protein